MIAPRLTDAQVSQALRAHLPDGAQAGLRERILEAAETTSQERALPSFFGALSEADPVTRRRSLLIAAALLVAMALASAVAVGAWRQLHQDPLTELQLERPADVPAFVLSAHDRMPQLPPVAFTTLKSDGTEARIYVDRSGAVRIEGDASADATVPAKTTILNGTSIGGTAHVGPKTVWLVGDEVISDDPRVFILSLSGLEFSDVLGCATSVDPSETDNATAATGWRYVGADSVAGRPAHHVTCTGGDLWIDDATRLILRVRQPDLDGDGNPVPGGAVHTTEVTKIEFGEQPAGLFALTPPNGVEAMSSETYRELCPGDTTAFAERPCSGTDKATPTPEPEPSPSPTVRPDPSNCGIPSRDSSEPTGPLAWTPASLKQDWPAPVRPEPIGGESSLPMPPTYIDPLGDTGSDVLPCVDIRDLTVGTYDVFLDLASNVPPDVDPSKTWIAYGVVVDDDRDGVPDLRYGIDNLPRTAGDEQGHHREWRTDLHTGRTESAGDSDWDKVSQTFLDTGYPAEGDREGFRTGRDGARFRFGHVSDTTGGTITRGVKVDMPLYAWASVIVDGRVVATDYAPDTGWLLPTPGANPGGTYVVHVDARLPRLSIDIPNGWTAPGSDSQVSDGRPWGDSVGLDLMIIDKPGLNACGSGGTALATIGRSADDLAAFLAGQPEIKVSQSTDLTLDGYRGRYLEYTTSDQDDCDPDNRPFWPVITNSGGGREYHQVWILDVDGVRLVIDGFAPKASETVKAELLRIVESIDIGP